MLFGNGPDAQHSRLSAESDAFAAQPADHRVRHVARIPARNSDASGHDGKDKEVAARSA